ncbi:MAG TPA: hypothetical protein VI032_12625 [Burkholderiaceae bacterium]
MSRRALCALAASLAALTQATFAQDRVYRCGDAYVHEACADGRGIDVADARSAQQAAQARQVALRDARQADALERQRLQAERLAARQGPVLIGPSVKPTSFDDKRCAKGKGAACSRGEPSTSRKGKTPSVTLYRAAATR